LVEGIKLRAECEKGSDALNHLSEPSALVIC
jgi:hypothetical protein